MKNLVIASTSTLHEGTYLDYLLGQIEILFEHIDTVLFIPYARPGGISHDEYLMYAEKVFAKIGKRLVGIHEFENTEKAVEQAKGIFTGGGNTFLLVQQLYKNNVFEGIKRTINAGTPYLGTSAGSNICGLTMSTTNDMPIVYPPSFKTFGFVPFNINPHYLDPIKGSTHMGETRETRIKEFHKFNTQPVIGLREGSWLNVYGDEITLKGKLNARIFEYGKTPYELPPESDLSNLR